MKKVLRKAEEFAPRTKSGKATFTIDQICDVCDLLKAKEYPDGRFSDDECCLFSVLREEFGIEI